MVSYECLQVHVINDVYTIRHYRAKTHATMFSKFDKLSEANFGDFNELIDYVDELYSSKRIVLHNMNLSKQQGKTLEFIIDGILEI